MKLLIATGIYPPDIGGPAQYAKQVADAWRRQGHSVKVRTFTRFERALPTGIRHIWFFFKALPAVVWSEGVLALDAFSVGMPTVLAARLLRRRAVIRTGGDFLWEFYVERTGDPVLFTEFYVTRRKSWNVKERVIYRVSRWTLLHADEVIFSTTWQRDIFVPAYGLDSKRTHLVENYYGPKAAQHPKDSGKKTIVAGTRRLAWKNLDALKRISVEITNKHPEVEFDFSNAPYEPFFEKIRGAYAVALVSLGDISPNMILDAIRAGTPFVCTRETGFRERLRDVGLFVDPKNDDSIRAAFERILDPQEYQKLRERVDSFSFVHTWDNIGSEISAIIKKPSS